MHKKVPHIITYDMVSNLYSSMDNLKEWMKSMNDQMAESLYRLTQNRLTQNRNTNNESLNDILDTQMMSMVLALYEFKRNKVFKNAFKEIHSIVVKEKQTKEIKKLVQALKSLINDPTTIFQNLIHHRCLPLWTQSSNIKNYPFAINDNFVIAITSNAFKQWLIKKEKEDQKAVRNSFAEQIARQFNKETKQQQENIKLYCLKQYQIKSKLHLITRLFNQPNEAFLPITIRLLVMLFQGHEWVDQINQMVIDKHNIKYKLNELITKHFAQEYNKLISFDEMTKNIKVNNKLLRKLQWKQIMQTINTSNPTHSSIWMNPQCVQALIQYIQNNTNTNRYKTLKNNLMTKMHDHKPSMS